MCNSGLYSIISEIKIAVLRLMLVLLVIHALAMFTLAGNVIRVGVYHNPPKVIILADGRTTGIFPELLNIMARQNQWEIQYVLGTWQECQDRLVAGEIDLMVDLAVSEDKQTIFSFTEEPVLVNWDTAFSRSDISVNSFLDFEGRSVAVMKESIHTEGRESIKELIDRFGISCQYIEVADHNDVLMLVDSKQADLGIVNRLFGSLHSDEFEIASTPIIFNPRRITFAACKGIALGNQIITAINEYLIEAKTDSDSLYQQILAYYLAGGVGDLREWGEDYAQQLVLTSEEKTWIKEHPRIRFSVDPGFAPFEYIDEDGEYLGMAADFMNLVSQKTGLQFDLVVQDSWPESIQAIKDREIDVLPCIGFSDERETFISYGESYLRFARVIVTQMGLMVTSLEDLEGMDVAIQSSSSHHAFLEVNSAIQPHEYNRFEDCLLAVSSGEADATIGNLAVTTHLLRSMALTNIKLAAYADPIPQNLHYGVRKDWPELTSIIDRVLDSVTLQQRQEILAKWLPLSRDAQQNIDLTQEEREWLLMHPRIRVAWDRSWAPIEFAGPDGEANGISVEYLKALEKLLGIQFDMSDAPDWQTAYKMLENRDLDMSSCLAITADRLSHLSFTDVYLNSPVVFFARDDMPFIDNMKELKDLRVAVVRDYATEDWVRRDHPDMPLADVPNMAQAFELLSREKIDVFIGSVLPGNYYLSKHRYQNIKIVGETQYSYRLRMGVRKDWPIFSAILKKTLATLTDSDKTAFYRKWVWVRYEHGFDYTLLGKVLTVVLLIIFVFIYWNRRLMKEVRHRKEVQAALAKSESALRESYEELKKLEQLKESLTYMIVHDMRSPLATITGALDLLVEAPENTDIEDLHLARAGVQAATIMAQSLLDIGRLENGQMPLKQESLDLKTVAEDAIQATDILARLAEVRIDLSGDSTSVTGDPDILHRVMVNLIGNAIQASPKSSTIQVRILEQESINAVEVQDTGCGISPEVQEVLFDRFAAADVDGSRKRTSVGLGLAFCKLAIEAHGGTIEVESQEGQGSTFRFELPRTGSPAE